MTTHKSYSATRGWLTHIQTASDKATIQDLVYTRDSSSLITGIDSPHPNETWRYTYDALKRLISAENITDPGWDQQFEYNEIGNMTYNSQIGTYTYPDPGHPASPCRLDRWYQQLHLQCQWADAKWRGTDHYLE